MKIFKRALITAGLTITLFATASPAMAINIPGVSEILALVKTIKTDMTTVTNGYPKIISSVESVITAGPILVASTKIMLAEGTLFDTAKTKSNAASIANASKQNTNLINSQSKLHNQLAVFNTPTTVSTKDAQGKTTNISTLSSNTMTKPLTYSTSQQTAVKHYQTIANGTGYASPALATTPTNVTPTALSYAVYHKTTSQIRSNTVNMNANIVAAHTGGKTTAGKALPSAHEQEQTIIAGISSKLSTAGKYWLKSDMFFIRTYLGLLQFLRSIPAHAKSFVKTTESIVSHAGSLVGYTGIAMETALGEALHMNVQHDGDEQFQSLKKKAGA